MSDPMPPLLAKVEEGLARFDGIRENGMTAADARAVAKFFNELADMMDAAKADDEERGLAPIVPMPLGDDR